MINLQLSINFRVPPLSLTNPPELQSKALASIMPHPAAWSLLKFTGFPVFIDARSYLLPTSFPLNFLANFVETRDSLRARL